MSEWKLPLSAEEIFPEKEVKPKEAWKKPDCSVKAHFVKTDDFNPFDSVRWVTRKAEIVNPTTGEKVFSADDLEFPESWSQNCVALVAEKYFRHVLQVDGSKVRETSVRQMISRVADTITKWGVGAGYFSGTERGSGKSNSRVFRDELVYILLHQMAAFNSPVWFNVGTNRGELGTEPASACFINSLEDNMDSILQLAKTEGLLYKGGSGSGVNYSALRSSREPLSGGGFSSGPVSFIAKDDANAGAIRSGGTCLAPWQRVYTEHGPIPVKDLVGKDFIVLSYDPPAGRYKAKRAQAWHAGQKRVVRVTTDKGQFDTSFDHPFKLSSGECVKAEELKSGMSLLRCSVDSKNGYTRVHLRNGKKGKELLHRLVVSDVDGRELKGLIVHHRDHDIRNNTLKNLEVMNQSEHASLHGRELVESGNHVFQKSSFSHAGDANGMHSSSRFWKDEQKVSSYKKKQGDILKTSGRAVQMQKLAVRQKMINLGYKLINAGCDISTFPKYLSSRKKEIGGIGYSTAIMLDKFSHHFGSYENFLHELRANNHRVLSVETLGFHDVYDVEVDCPTADDKSSQSGHNFVIWDGDDFYGSGVVVLNTRRAAKMAILNADHGDIFDFVKCKAHGEKAAHALVDAGFGSDFRDRWGAYNTVPFQNANHSVRVTDAFMEAVMNDEDWDLLTREGEVLETVRAKELWDEICEAAHVCGDPGLQFDTTINKWHTTPAHGRIHGSNPCAEFMYLDNTACNLSSLNLLKFLEDGVLRIEDFRHTVDVMITAMDILVDDAKYPSEQITDNSKKFRPLGLGYTNLGAFLMAQGMPYDSDEGRSIAAGVTSILAGRAYTRSAQLAKELGPFEGFEANKDSMLRVIENHAAPISDLVTHPDYRNWATYDWDVAYDFGCTHGYRNSQVTVLAPCGTISFAMDCDTTGIEPELSLSKTKKLVGGGTITIVNQQVARALDELGYGPKAIDKITQYAVKNNSLVNSGLQDFHLPIFDTSFPEPVSNRTLRPTAHLLMMTAVQPFLSGSISKTVNVSCDSTAEDISNLYKLAWQYGLKSVAIYRDGCKRTQPLQSKTTVESERAPEPLQLRQKLPNDCMAHRHKFQIGQNDGYMHVGLYPDGKPGEVFVRMAQVGSTVQGLMDALGVLTSIALQYGVPLEVLVRKFSYTQFEPAGFTGHPAVKFAKSPLDYVFRWLASEYLTIDDDVEVSFEEEIKTKVRETVMVATGHVCERCGNPAQRAGACVSCSTCGWTEGCS